MKRKVLFVDDEQNVLEGLHDLLHRERASWDMTFALGPDRALEALAATRFDVVVTDMRMSGMDGAQLLKHVQASHPEAARIVLSGHHEVEAALRAVPVAHLFLAKPCDPVELRSVVERVCGLQALLGDSALRSAATAPGVLPSAPGIFRRLTDTLADPHSGMRDVAEIIAGDPALAAKVLQLVNSAFFGVGRCIGTIEEAVSCLGGATIKAVVLSSFCDELAGPELTHGRDLTGLREHSALVAKIAASIVGTSNSADDAFMAGILHDVGKLVLLAYEPEYLEEAVAAAEEEHIPLHIAERDLRGSSHAEVGAYLLTLWGLPFGVVEAVARHHDRIVPDAPISVSDAVKVADLLAVELHPVIGIGPVAPLNGELDGIEPAELERLRTLARASAGPLLSRHQERALDG